MRKIPDHHVRRWVDFQKLRVPKAVATFCPHCSEQVIFDLKDGLRDGQRIAAAFSAPCPACAKSAGFWAVGKSGDRESVEVFVYPPGGTRRVPKDYGELVPEPLKRAYEAAVLALASKNYVATSVCSRRTLEGIFKYALHGEDQDLTLARAIDKVKDTRDLSKPLTTLSHAIRQGGNLGAHFDPEHEPTEELAAQMVELLEYLIEFVYTLPTEIARLEDALSSTPTTGSSDTTG